MSIKKRRECAVVESEFDAEAAKRINKVIEQHPVSLSGCAAILETIAPMIDILTWEGTGRILKDVTKIRCSDFAPELVKTIRRLSLQIDLSAK